MEDIVKIIGFAKKEPKTLGEMQEHFGWDNFERQQIFDVHLKKPEFFKMTRKIIEKDGKKVRQLAWVASPSGLEHYKNNSLVGQLSKIKEKWLVFLLYGIIIIALGAIINFLINQHLTESLQGPPCRIVTALINDEFQMNKSTTFDMYYKIENLRNEKMRIEDTNAYCFWGTQKSIKQVSEGEEYISPLIQGFPIEKPPLEELGFVNKKLKGCKSPSEKGRYEITIYAETNKGRCEKTLTMVVV